MFACFFSNSQRAPFSKCRWVPSFHGHYRYTLSRREMLRNKTIKFPEWVTKKKSIIRNVSENQKDIVWRPRLLPRTRSLTIKEKWRDKRDSPGIVWLTDRECSLFLHRSNQRGKGHKTRSQSGRLVTLSKIFFLKKKGKNKSAISFCTIGSNRSVLPFITRRRMTSFSKLFFFFFRWDNNKKKGVKIKKKTNRTMGPG